MAPRVKKRIDPTFTGRKITSYFSASSSSHPVVSNDTVAEHGQTNRESVSLHETMNLSEIFETSNDNVGSLASCSMVCSDSAIGNDEMKTAEIPAGLTASNGSSDYGLEASDALNSTQKGHTANTRGGGKAIGRQPLAELSTNSSLREEQPRKLRRLNPAIASSSAVQDTLSVSSDLSEIDEPPLIPAEDDEDFVDSDFDEDSDLGDLEEPEESLAPLSDDEDLVGESGSNAKLPLVEMQKMLDAILIAHPARPRPTTKLETALRQSIRMLKEASLKWKTCLNKESKTMRPFARRLLDDFSEDLFVDVFMTGFEETMTSFFEKSAWDIEDFQQLRSTRDIKKQGIYIHAVTHSVNRTLIAGYCGSSMNIGHRNKAHEQILRPGSRSQKSFRYNLYYSQIRNYRLDEHIESRTRRTLATFEPPLPIVFLHILEGIMTVWFSTLRAPASGHYEWNTPAVMVLVKKIRDDVAIAHAPDWLPLNAAFQLMQICKTEDVRPLALCAVPGCGLQEERFQKRPFSIANFEGVPPEIIGQYICNVCLEYMRRTKQLCPLELLQRRKTLKSMDRPRDRPDFCEHPGCTKAAKDFKFMLCTSVPKEVYQKWLCTACYQYTLNNKKLRPLRLLVAPRAAVRTSAEIGQKCENPNCISVCSGPKQFQRLFRSSVPTSLHNQWFCTQCLSYARKHKTLRPKHLCDKLLAKKSK